MSRRLLLLLPVLLLAGYVLLSMPTRRGATTATPSAAIAADLGIRSAEVIGVSAERSPAEVAPAVRSESALPAIRTWNLRSELFFADGSKVPASESVDARWRVRVHSADGDVSDGIWVQGALHARPGERLVVLEARDGDRRITPRNDEIELVEQDEVTLVGDLPADGRLRVVDARTGEDLESVLVVPGLDYDTSGELPPLRWLLEPDAARDAGASPIVLPANSKHASYWIGGEGYAWRRIEFGASSGEPLYALEPGGALRLDVDPPGDRSMEYVARIERADGELFAELPLTGKVATLSGLPAGPARVAFVGNHRRYVPSTIATRDVELAPGRTAELTLDLDPLWRHDEFGKIQVTLLLEDPTDAATLELVVEALDVPDPRRHSIEVRRLREAPDRGLVWGTGPRAVGRHRITASPGSASVIVDVQSGTTTPVRLDVPTLARVRLWTTDASHGGAVQPDLVLWRARPQSGEASPENWQFAKGHALDGGLAFPVARGPVELAVRAQGYGTSRLEIEVDDVWQEAVLELEPIEARELLVRLMSDGQPVPAAHTTWSSTRVTDPTGESVLAQVRPVSDARTDDEWPDGASAVVLVKHPGPCQLTVGEVPGFTLPRTRSLTIEEQRTTVDVELTLVGSR